jgi:hypothetical protein
MSKERRAADKSPDQDDATESLDVVHRSTSSKSGSQGQAKAMPTRLPGAP